MGSVGDCYDNAMCESFFATLECELLERLTLRTPREARSAVFDFIEREWGKDAVRDFVYEWRSSVGGGVQRVIKRAFDISPEDFAATLFHAMDIAPDTRISPDGFTQPASTGQVLAGLF